MNLENIMLSEYVDSKKQKTKQKQTHRENKLVVARGEESGRWAK